MGKKIKKEMDAQRERFVTGAVDRGIAKATADAIFDACAKFAEYGFNKSHSAPYAFITYQTAWFKANHPAEFLAASMTLDKGNTDKLAEFRAEAQRLGIKVVPPSVNESHVDFDVRVSADGAPAIHLRLERDQGRRRSAGRGAGRRARRAAPLLRSPIWRRGSIRAIVNKKAMESLAAAGAFDCLEPERADRLRGDRADARDRQPRRYGESLGPERAVRRDRGARRSRARRAMGRGRAAQARVRRGRVLPLRSSARSL